MRESRVIADLLLASANEHEWTQAVQQDNRLQKRSSATAKRQAQAIRKRLEHLDEPFWRALRDGDDELATQVAFCSVLARNLLLVEFIETVVRDAFVTRAEVLESYQWRDFLEDRSNRDSAIGDWAESSKRKMGQVAFRILAEVGLIKSTRKPQLQRLLARPEVIVLLEDSRRDRIKSCLTLSSAAVQQKLSE